MHYLLRLADATRYSFKGLAAAWRHEPAFRTEAFLTPFVIAAAIAYGESGVERLLMAGSWILVLIVELLNSGIEAAVDRIGRERHDLAGRAKDLGSAAVFVSLLLAAITWITLLVQ